MLVRRSVFVSSSTALSFASLTFSPERGPEPEVIVPRWNSSLYTSSVAPINVESRESLEPAFAMASAAGNSEYPCNEIIWIGFNESAIDLTSLGTVTLPSWISLKAMRSKGACAGTL